jgi:glycosyltransferase involved in cell wall biosynthesis
MSMIEDGKNGFILKINSAKELAEKFLILKENPILKKQMGEKAKKFTKRYNKNKIINKYMDVCYKLSKKV